MAADTTAVCTHVRRRGSSARCMAHGRQAMPIASRATICTDDGVGPVAEASTWKAAEPSAARTASHRTATRTGAVFGFETGASHSETAAVAWVTQYFYTCRTKIGSPHGRTRHGADRHPS